MAKKEKLISEIVNLMDEFYDPTEINVVCFDLHTKKAGVRVCDTEIDTTCEDVFTKKQYLVVEIHNVKNQAEIEKEFVELSEPEIICDGEGGKKLLFYPGHSIELF